VRQPIPRPDDAITLPRPTATTGRPTTLTNDVANKILLAIKSGSYRGVAAVWAGIPIDQFHRWLGMSGEPYESFKKLVEEAEAYAELKAVSRVTKTEDPKMAVAFLERRFAARWARPASPATNVTLDLGSMLERIHQRVAQFKDPREARRALAPGAVQVLDAEGRALPHDPRPPRRQPVTVTRPVRQPVTVLPPVPSDDPDETFDGERDIEQID
jgi:hypothetical protein